MITFNNIVERFEIFAQNHFFIKTFSFGSPDDADLSKFTDFPLMHLVYTGANYDAGTKTYNIEVYILDVPADKNDKVERQKEVVSDAEQCAEDIIADIKNGGNIFLFAQDYEVVNATTTPLEEETKNVLSGVLLDLSVAIPYEWDACNAPIDGVEPGGTEVTYARRGVLRMLTIDGTTDVQSVRTINVTNGTLTDDGDGVVTLDTGGAETLNDLTDVDTTGVTDGQVLKYDNASGEWLPGNDQSATSLGNLDDVSIVTPANREALIYDGSEWVNDTVSKGDIGLGNVDNTSDADKPVSTATQTALNAKANTADVPTSLNDLSDVSIVGTPTGNQALIYDATANAFKSQVSYTNRFEDDVETGKQGITGTERAYSVKGEGDGVFADPESDTPAAGKVIKRKIYHKTGFITDADVIGDYTLIHTFADDTAYADTVATFEGFEDGATYGVPPFTLLQTWEEVAAAPTFTGLLNESYGSGAEAAYSTRRLNGNITECMVIRRASDSTTTTIGFDGSGNINEADIISFCTGTTCTVSEWKDQSGNGNDATAAAQANEPTIYTGGALVKENGKLALDFDGSNDGFPLDTTSLDIGSLSSFTTGKFNATSGSGMMLGLSGGGSNKRWYAPYLANTNFNFGYANSGTAVNTGADTNRHLFTMIAGTTLNSMQAWASSASVGTATLTTGIDSNKNGIGNLNGTLYGNCNVQESIFYTSDKSSVRTSIESNIADYFTQNTPLLDTYTGAAAAYSLRLLDSTYTQALINVWNGTSYADIYPNVFGELDTVALAAHCGSNDGFIRYWYDQSGNTNTAAQTTLASMPKIYDGTTGVVTDNGKPVINYNNPTTNVLNLTSALSSVQSVFQILSSTRSNVYAPILGDSTSKDYHPGTAYQILRSDQSASFVLNGDNRINGQTVDFTSTAGRKPTSQSLLTLIHTSASGNVSSFSNDRGISGRNWDGNMHEIIIYENDQSSNRSDIEDNINTFYNIY